MPQGPHFQQIVDWPPEAHKQSHKNLTASTRPKRTQLLHGLSATLPTQELTSFSVWVEPHHLLTTTPTSHLHCPSSGPTVCIRENNSTHLGGAISISIESTLIIQRGATSIFVLIALVEELFLKKTIQQFIAVEGALFLSIIHAY